MARSLLGKEDMLLLTRWAGLRPGGDDEVGLDTVRGVEVAASALTSTSETATCVLAVLCRSIAGSWCASDRATVNPGYNDVRRGVVLYYYIEIIVIDRFITRLLRKLV